MTPSTPPPLCYPPQPAAPAKSSAVTAGWLCLLLGCLTFWIVGIGFVFFPVVVILSIVAMCSNHVGQGIALLVSAIASAALCVLVFFALIFGTLSAGLRRANSEPFPASRYHPLFETQPR